MRQPDKHVLEKILEEIAFLESLLNGVDLDAFISDETVKRAAAMASINIGELAKHLSDDFYAAYPGSELRYAARATCMRTATTRCALKPYTRRR